MTPPNDLAGMPFGYQRYESQLQIRFPSSAGRQHCISVFGSLLIKLTDCTPAILRCWSSSSIRCMPDNMAACVRNHPIVAQMIHLWIVGGRSFAGVGPG